MGDFDDMYHFNDDRCSREREKEPDDNCENECPAAPAPPHYQHEYDGNHLQNLSIFSGIPGWISAAQPQSLYEKSGNLNAEEEDEDDGAYEFSNNVYDNVYDNVCGDENDYDDYHDYSHGHYQEEEEQIPPDDVWLRINSLNSRNQFYYWYPSLSAIMANPVATACLFGNVLALRVMLASDKFCIRQVMKRLMSDHGVNLLSIACSYIDPYISADMCNMLLMAEMDCIANNCSADSHQCHRQSSSSSSSHEPRQQRHSRLPQMWCHRREYGCCDNNRARK